MIESSRVVLPKSRYKFRVVKAVRGISQKQQPKIDVDLELVDNADVTPQNSEDGPHSPQSPNGMQIRTWLSEQPQSLEAVNRFLRSVGCKPITLEELLTWNVALIEGQVGYGIAEGKEKPNLDSNNQPILNPYTDKPQMRADNKFTEFFPKPS